MTGPETHLKPFPTLCPQHQRRQMSHRGRDGLGVAVVGNRAQDCTALRSGPGRRRPPGRLPRRARADAGRNGSAGRVEPTRPPSPAPCRAHARGRPGEVRRPRPRFLSPNDPPDERRRRRRRRRLPGAPELCSTLGSARAPRPAPGMEPDSSSSLSAGPRTRDPSPRAPRQGGRSPHHAPNSAGSDQTWPRLPGREIGGTAVERGSGNPAWSNRTRTSGREWGPVERGRRGERERQKIPKPVALPHGGTVPPPLPARDQLPSCSQRKNPSRSGSSAGTGRSARAPPTQALHSASPQASLPGHCTSRGSLAAGTGPAPAPAAGPRSPPPPSARFQIEIPWLGPSEGGLGAPAPPPRGGSPSCASGAETPAGRTTPPALKPRPWGSPSRGIRGRGRRVPRAGKMRLAVRTALVNDC
ncbi:basic salivary proline-rich protein 1-like [Eumetopias jubatus]|uniref:basic salivary proline-rich protein 1-like n=1 Tax=Eumetopias jubatus TaxID=34886 RepID=UPI001015DFB7|nr:basic salivary proline-rich protein 1-like [Eumetopias jubatus]